ncbi:hypothetical protein THOM_1368 [Trachipleistophora hominis]|uniref:Uncharacterized protein n=1 Tax=Trachipleistophora hominis TaxID=72359 RepID=L7JXE4_TRAHO|nr:hypothetical protein THOM_1368 [Trachipleistophora hominis]
MSDDGDTKKTSRLVGYIALGLSVVLYLGLVAITYFVMADTFIFHAWWWSLGTGVGIVAIIAVIFLLKGLIGMIVNTLLFIVVLLLIFAQYWFRSERVLVLGSIDDAAENFGASDADALGTELLKDHPRRIFVFIGKMAAGGGAGAKSKQGSKTTEEGEEEPNASEPEGQGEPEAPEPESQPKKQGKTEITEEAVKKALESETKKASEAKEKVHVVQLADNLKYEPGKKESAKNIVKAFKKFSFARHLDQGVLRFEDDVEYGKAFEEGEGTKEGMNVKDFSEKYKKKDKK